MARKKGRVPSPSPTPSPSPPPPTPPREDSSSEDEEEPTPATQKAPPNPKPLSTATADADSSAGGEEEESSDSETDANAFQLREVARSPGKPSESAADEGDGSSSYSPEPVQKKAAGKPKAESGKKRQADAESIPSAGKAKKAKADVEKAAAPLSGKEPSEPSSSSKGKKHKEKAAPDRSPSKPGGRRWTAEDETKVLGALVSHIKTHGTQPSALDLIAAVGDSLERKSCSKTEMYEKVRNLKQKYEKAASAGTLPANDDDLKKFYLSEAVWGESAKEAAAALISQNDAASSKSKKGQTSKEKKAGTAKKVTGTVNQNVKTLAEIDKGQATKEKLDGDTKGRLSKKAATADTPAKSKKQGNRKEESEDDAKTGTTKEATNTPTQNGSTLVRSKIGKSDKAEKDGDAESLGPKEGTAVTQNGDTLAETHEEEMDIDLDVENMSRGFDELQNLYPNLTSYVESIQAQHPCGETLKRAFEFISDEKACDFESKIKKQRVAEMKVEIRQAGIKKEVTSIFIGLLD